MENRFNEPWYYDHRKAVIRNRNENMIGIKEEERAIKCVNACTGINDPKSFIERSKKMEELIKAMTAYIDFMDENFIPPKVGVAEFVIKRKSLWSTVTIIKKQLLTNEKV